MVACLRRDDSTGQSPSRRRCALAGHTVRARLWRDYLRSVRAGDASCNSETRGGDLEIIASDLLGFPPGDYCDYLFMMCSARFSTFKAASLTASLKVGCEWQVRPISSELPPNSMTETASAINSEAA